MYLLGGLQTDFARNWAREGLEIADAMRPTDRSWNWSPDLNAYRPGCPMWQEVGITHERAMRMQTKYGGHVWQNPANA